MQNILFTTIIGPYGVDSHRSRFKNPMSLLSNQITRGQKYYTVQMCQRTYAFDLFGANLDANVTVLNFPLEKHLVSVLKKEKWDRVGISSIVQNFESVLATYKIIRNACPNAAIDIGGHIVTDEEVMRQLVMRISKINSLETFNVWKSKTEDENCHDSEKNVNFWLKQIKYFGTGVTFIKRDGLEYYAQLEGVGLKDAKTFYAPLVDASFDKKVLGLHVPGTSAGMIIPDLGCPMRCNFCATSHKFQGNFVHLLSTAEDIMSVANAQADRGVPELFVLSENFALNVPRLEKLLKLMEEQKRSHMFNVFASANGLIRLGIENITKLGFRFVWIGLEDSTGSTFNKTHGINLKELVKSLQDHGVTVLGSTILGFEHHKMDDVNREIDYALTYSCVYNQFMLAMSMPGTVLWQNLKEKKMLKENFPWADAHGQSRQNWHHSHLGEEELEKKLDEAFKKDFDVLGPSLFRMMKVHYNGYINTKDWNHELVQMRRNILRKEFVSYHALLRVMYKDLKKIRHCRVADIKALEKKIFAELGILGRLKSKAIEHIFYITLQLEKRRYYKSQKKKIIKDPSCSLTNYGNFKWKVPGIIPKIIKAPVTVAIPRV